MKRALIPAFVVFASAIFASASAQTLNLSSISDPKASLNDKMSFLLTDRQVLSDLKLTSAQSSLLVIRTMLFPIRTLPKTVVAMSEADTNEEGPMATINFDSVDVPRLTLEDLSNAQRKRLRQLYFQLDPVSALASKELKAELKLSPHQCQVLEKNSKQKGAILLASAKKYMTMKAFNGLEEMGNILRSLQKDDNSDEAKKALIEKYERMMTLLEQSFAKIVAQMEKDNSEKTPGFTKRSLNVLTPTQRSKYNKLCGRKLKS